MATTYTQNNDANAQATFGQSGPSVLAYQTQLNQKNQGKPGYVPLKLDGKYGPLTQAAAGFKPSSQLIVTSGAADSTHTKYSGLLDNALSKFNLNSAISSATPEKKLNVDNYSDSYTQALDRQAQSSNDSAKAMIATMQAQYQQKKNETKGQYDNYKRGLQLLGIQHNDAQSTPDLLMGHIQSAQNEYMSKINSLDGELNKALMDAQTARDKNDTMLLKEKMDYVKTIQAEKDNALKDAYDKMNYETKIAENQAAQIYDTLQTLPEADKQMFLQQVAQKYNIPLGTLVTALTDEKNARTEKANKSSSDGSGKKLTLTQIETFKDKYTDFADQIKYGMTEGEVNDIINGEVTPEEEAIKPVQKMRVIPPGNVKFKQLGISNSDLKDIRTGLKNGYSIDEIIASFGLSTEAADLIKQYIVDL